jgi:Ca2+/Na+ antiporter
VTTDTDEAVRHTERWFVRHGVPLMIADYGFATYVLPRMVPFLGLVAVTGLLWPLRGHLTPGQRFVAVLGVLAVGLVAGVLPARLWRLPLFPRRASVLVLVLYAGVPVAVPLLERAASRTVTSPQVRAGEITDGATGPLTAALGFGLLFGALFAIAWAATTFGALPLLGQGVRYAGHDMRNTVRLQSRALPTLLFVTLFFFFTGELWQAMDRLSWWRLTGVLALFAAVTVLAAAGRLREEIGRVEQNLSPERLEEACRDTPLSGLPVRELVPDGTPHPPPLHRLQVANLLILLASRQIVQAFVVGLGLFGFFLVLGLLVVDDATAEQWIGAPAHHSSAFPGVAVALLRNAALLAGFGSMYFAVTSMVDAEPRRQFFAPILDEVSRTLAVRAVYLLARERSVVGKTR